LADLGDLKINGNPKNALTVILLHSHHSPTDHDGSTDSKHRRRHVYCHFESSSWCGYAEI